MKLGVLWELWGRILQWLFRSRKRIGANRRLGLELGGFLAHQKLQNEALAQARCLFCRDTIFPSGSPFSAQMERQRGPKGPPGEVQGHAATVAKSEAFFRRKKYPKRGPKRGPKGAKKLKKVGLER